MNYYVVPWGAEHYEWFARGVIEPGETWFSGVPKSAQVGDKVFAYLTAPVSSIVGRMEVARAPFFHVEGMFDNVHLKNRWVAEIGKVVYYPPHTDLTMAGLRRLFPDWPWLRYPRGQTSIPPDVLQPFLKLMKRRNGRPFTHPA